MKLDPQKTVYLIDGSSFLYRAYYAMKPLHTKQGLPVQAVYGYVRMIKKLIDNFNPSFMAVVWDSPGKTTRHETFEQYKATRQAPPSDLFEQKKLIKKFNKSINLCEVEASGIEADDLIYSVGCDMRASGYDLVLVTTDKDMGQMIDEHTFVYDSFKDIMYDKAAFEQKMSVPVHKLPFYFALLGDSSDNIPGVRGIGEKGALELVNQFDSVEDMYARIDEVAKPRIRTALEQNKENAFLSYQLFLLQYYADHIKKDDLRFDARNWNHARSLFQELDFKSLLKDMPEVAEAQTFQQNSIFQESNVTPLDYQRFKKVVTEEDLKDLVLQVKNKKLCAIDTETTGLDLLKDQIIGISCATAIGQAWYVPFGHKTGETQLSTDCVFAALKPLLEDASIKKYMHHASFDKAALWHAGIDVQGIVFDTLLAAKLTNKGWQKSGLKDLSEHYLNQKMLSFDQVINDYQNFSYVPLDLATEYAASDAHQTLALHGPLEKELEKEKQKKVFDTIEQPLQPILFAMEETGIFLDVAELALLGRHVTRELIEIEDAIITIAGPAHAQINLNSPRQVEHLLFTHLKLTPQRKSAKGSYSTDSQVLQELAKNHPIPGMILKYRELAKLKTTYIDALPTYVNPKTGRIHTHFSQTAVATGRLASSNPNLQNIPASSSGYGIEVRAAFKPDAGEVFISADYSQIELRVLAYLSQDERLLNAFKHDEDIHTQTAASLFGLPVDAVSHQQRQIGKRINFSVLYGLTPYGLSKDLDIPLKDAKLYIEAYFNHYPGVRAWMDGIIEQAKEDGYVTTLYGRRRYIPAIHESNQVLYKEAVRVAINTVAQGTAAEIMKIGMMKCVDVCRQKKMRARLVLQIHDELLISVHKEDVHNAQSIIKDLLEHVVDWNVPLKVTVCSGNNWKEVTK